MNPKKASTGARRDEEWVPSHTGEVELNRLVEAGVLPDRVTAGWQPALGEPYTMPHTDEVVVFEDYFWRGLGFPVHLFLRDLLEFWRVSLCNLHPNTILHISIFIHFYEAYLGILPHFNLFCHLFWLKKRGGDGSKVVCGVYLQLCDGMAGEYLTMLLNTSLKGWNTRWFYMKQGHPIIRCDADHILESLKSWSERPSNADMEQVRELLSLIKGMKTNGGLVVTSFIVRRIQPARRGPMRAMTSRATSTAPERGRRCYRGTMC